MSRDGKRWDLTQWGSLHTSPCFNLCSRVIGPSMAIDDCLADMPSRREAEKMGNEHVILRQEPWVYKARPRQYVPEDERDPAGGVR
jgi:hypothetical protein